MILARRILFFIFLVIYLSLCPLLILYAFGYIFNPVSQQITRTGLIHLASEPAGAHIYLEKSHYSRKTPASIEQLKPGKYKVTLKLKKYKNWVHAVSVSAGGAAAFDNIMLVPKAWRKKDILPQTFIKLIPINKSEYFILAGGSPLGSYSIYNWKDAQLTPLLPKGSPFYDFPVISIFTESNNNAFIAYGGALWSRKYLRVTFKEEEESQITDLGKKLLMPKHIFRHHADKKIVCTKTSIWKRPLKKPVYSRGENITNCFLFYDDSHIVFNDSDKLFMLEIQPQGKHRLEFIADIKKDSSIFYTDITGCVYFLEPQRGHLYEIQLLAPQP